MLDEINALLLEDNDSDAELFDEAIKPYRHIHVFRIKSVSDLAECVTSVYPDILVIDLNLAGTKGLQTLTEVQKVMCDAGNGSPVIVLTGVDDLEMVNTAINMGAQDWLIKGEVNGNLKRAIAVAVARHNAIREASQQLRNYILEKFKPIIGSTGDLHG